MTTRGTTRDAPMGSGGTHATLKAPSTAGGLVRALSTGMHPLKKNSGSLTSGTPHGQRVRMAIWAITGDAKNTSKLPKMAT